MSAPGADAAQPGTAPDGQGQGQDPSAYTSVFGEDAFSDAPEELRPHLQKYVQTQVDPRLTQRFQEAAQFRSQWEPFSQIEGLSDLHPDDVNDLVEFGYTVAAAQDENHPQRQQAVEQLQQTWEQLGEQFGFFEGEEGEGDGEDEGDDEIAQLRAEIQELKQGHQQEQMQQSTQQIQTEIRGHVEQLSLPGKPGSDERQQAEDAVYTFMLRYDDPQMSNEEVVKAAFEDYQRLTGAGQRQLLEETDENAGGQTVRGGGADTAPEEVKGWREADKLAKARLMGANR